MRVHVEYLSIIKGGHSHFQRKQYFIPGTHTTRSLLGSDTDMVFFYQIELWVSGACEIVARTLSLSPSLYSTADVYSSSSRQSRSVRGNGGSRVEAGDV